MKMPDGGPAFPRTEYFDERPTGQTCGVTMRDYFAAQFVSSVLAHYLTANGNGCAADHALRNVPALAYKYADAMLAERAK